MVDFALEREAGSLCAGVDEAGRGPAAGPVAAAAVMLDPDACPAGLNDSKTLSAAKRERIYADLLASAAAGRAHIGLGFTEPEEIDRVNLLNATLNAMARAVAALPRAPRVLLVDGDKAPNMALPVRTVVGGDAKSASIAAASIIAKVSRDRLLHTAHDRWPAYGFDRHAGYLTAQHTAALHHKGPAPLHRRCFHPVRAADATLRRPFAS